jgi:uncharacterized membrane protein YhiD involved in acid resistance
MGSLASIFERGVGPSGETFETLILSLLLSFVLGQVIAWGYTATHSGLSYSRAYTQSLVLLSMVVALVMRVIGDNIVTAFGLLGALAIIRFRNVLKDTRDTVFVFLTLVVGMSVGSGKYMTAVVGTVAVVLVATYLHYTSFGSLGRFDGHLSFLLANTGNADGPDVLDLLARYCRKSKQVSVRHNEGGGPTEYIFQVRLADRDRSDGLVETLRGTPGVTDVALVLRDELSEV